MDKTYVIACKGLLATAIEKVAVLGYDEAQEDVKKLRDTVEDLVHFWQLDERILDSFDKTLENLK